MEEKAIIGGSESVLLHACSLRLRRAKSALNKRVSIGCSLGLCGGKWPIQQ